VAGDAAVLVNPECVEEIAEGLRQLTGDERLRVELKQRGLARAAQFPWEKAVDQTWNVYRELL
jgi:glycosyltransferase involved in cell wall biosynthesis